MSESIREPFNVITKDGKEVKVISEIVNISGFFSEIEDTTENVPLAGLNENILSKILEFIELYKISPLNNIQKPLQYNNLIENGIQKEYVDYIESMDISMLFHICNGAYFLLIKPLLDLCNARIALMVKGKTPLELKEIFMISAPYNPPNETELREKNKWAEYADCNVPIVEEGK